MPTSNPEIKQKSEFDLYKEKHIFKCFLLIVVYMYMNVCMHVHKCVCVCCVCVCLFGVCVNIGTHVCIKIEHRFSGS